MLKKIVVILVAIGVFRAVVHWNADENGQGIARLGLAIMHGAEDITYKWLPGLVDLLTEVISGLVGTAS